MKVILLDDVKGLGERGDTVNVAAGYARNFLIPRQRAVLATAAGLRVAKELSKSALRREAVVRAEAEADLSKLEGLSVSFVVNVSSGGKLFGSVSAADIAKAITDSGAALDVDRHDVLLSEPIKRVGSFTVPVRLFRDVRGQVEVVVEPSATSEVAEKRARPPKQAVAAEDAPPDEPSEEKTIEDETRAATTE